MKTGFLGSGASFSGSLPGSLAIAGDVLQGFGTYTFDVTGTDGTNTLILTVTIEVMEPTLTPVITGVTLNGGYHAMTMITAPTHGEAAVNAHFVTSVNAGEPLTMEFQWDQIKGSDGFTIVGGSLPDGLVLDRENGVISGTPTETGNFEFLISVKDWRGRGYQWVSLTVE